MKIAIIDSPTASRWEEIINRLLPLEERLSRQGHDVTLLMADGEKACDIVLTGLGRDGDTRAIVESRRAFQIVKSLNPDLCILPSRGGLAHGILMARGCGELRHDMRVALIAEETSLSLFLRSDMSENLLASVVADAMERFCVDTADVLLSPNYESLEWYAATGGGFDNCQKLACSSALTRSAVISHDFGKSDTLAFVGAFERASHIVAFIDAIERLAADGKMANRSVLFSGPIHDAYQAAGKSWLGRRALKWSFPFKIVETSSFRDAIRAALVPLSTVFVPNLPLALVDACAQELSGAKCRFLDAQHDLQPAVLAPILDGNDEQYATPRWKIPTKLPDVAFASMADIGDGGGVAPRSVSLSFCILHHERPGMLMAAVESIRNQLEPAWTDIDIVILDNASHSAESRNTLNDLEALSGVRVLRLSAALPVPAAMNRLVAETNGTFVVFLDDDNMMAEGGVAAIRAACLKGYFDIIASNLEIFDTDSPHVAQNPSIMTFIGPAATAGLFYNAFGDTCMAFKRTSFEQLGGFLEDGGSYPAADWIILARAQAADLKIGVLQTPAFRYRRNHHVSQVSWQKYDQQGARNILLSHYGGKFEPLILAKLSQRFAMEYI